MREYSGEHVIIYANKIVDHLKLKFQRKFYRIKYIVVSIRVIFDILFQIVRIQLLANP